MKTSILSTQTVKDLADDLMTNEYDVKMNKNTLIVTELNGNEIVRGIRKSENGSKWIVRYDTTIIK